jgi:hypothetical protein
MVASITWDPGPNGPVNKRNLSTGENGEFGVEGDLGWKLPRIVNAQRLFWENRKNRNTFQMFGIIVRSRGETMLSRKEHCEFEAEVVAPRHGFEPRFTAPKAAVLPLDDRGF